MSDWIRAGNVEPLGNSRLDCRGYDVDLLHAEAAAVAGVWIQAGDQEAR